jgi:hypothetical protein
VGRVLLPEEGWYSSALFGNDVCAAAAAADRDLCLLSAKTCYFATQISTNRPQHPSFIR